GQDNQPDAAEGQRVTQRTRGSGVRRHGGGEQENCQQKAGQRLVTELPAKRPASDGDRRWRRGGPAGPRGRGRGGRGGWAGAREPRASSGTVTTRAQTGQVAREPACLASA